jgi:hypothetical protein
MEYSLVTLQKGENIKEETKRTRKGKYLTERKKRKKKIYLTIYVYVRKKERERAHICIIIMARQWYVP